MPKGTKKIIRRHLNNYIKIKSYKNSEMAINSKYCLNYIKSREIVFDLTIKQKLLLLFGYELKLNLTIPSDFQIWID